MLSGGVYVNGERIHRGTMWPLSWSGEPSKGAVLRTQAGNQVRQRWAIGGDAPLTLKPISFSARMSCEGEEDYFRLIAAAAAGETVRIMPHLWIADAWYIPGRSEGQTTWRTSRYLPYGLPGISLSDSRYSAQVLVDGVLQTVISTGSPGAGEVLVPDAGGFAELVTPVGLSGTLLELRYCPEFLAVPELRWQNEQHNLLTYEIAFEDQILNSYTGAMPA